MQVPEDDSNKQRWSPDQPQDWTGVFGEPEPDSPNPSTEPTKGETQRIPNGLMPLRPLKVGETLGVSWQITRKNLRACFGVAGAAAAIVGTIELIVLVTLLRIYPESTSLGASLAEVFDSAQAPTQEQLNQILSEALPGLASALTGLALLQVAAFLVTAVLAHVVAGGVIAKPIGASAAWRATRGRTLSLLVLLVINTLLIVAAFALPAGVATFAASAMGNTGLSATVVGVGLGLSFVLGVVTFLRLLLAPVVLTLESASVRQSIIRSNRLVRKSSWRVFFVYFLASLLANAVALLVSFPFVVLAGDTGVITSQSVFFSTVGSILNYLIVLAFVSVTLGVLYTELRIRKENLAPALAKAKP